MLRIVCRNVRINKGNAEGRNAGRRPATLHMRLPRNNRNIDGMYPPPVPFRRFGGGFSFTGFARADIMARYD
nr:MAG TPA: hypothetical protein [Caudoviricetes sp.]